MEAVGQSEATAQKPYVLLTGGNARFRSFLGHFSEVEAFSDVDAMLAANPSPGMLCVLMPRYDDGQRLAEELGIDALYRLLEWKRKGVLLYVEAVPSKNYLSREVFSYFTLGRECHFNQDCIKCNNNLLQSSNLYYILSTVHANHGRKVLAEGGDFGGVLSPVREPSRRYPILLDDLEGCVSAMMNLHACEGVFLRPYAFWRELLGALWSALTGAPKALVEEAFEKAWPRPFAPSGGTDASAGLAAAVEWHRRCGLMPSPDGTSGILEMFMSADFSRRQNYRTDSILMTAALFAGCGAFSHDAQLTQIATALADFLLDRHIQDDTGFLRWYDHSSVVYANDSARHGLSLLYLWRMTGIRRYRDCAERLAAACLGWLGERGLYSGTFSLDEGDGGEVSRTPVFYGEMAAFLLCIGSSEARSAALKFAELVEVASQAMGHSRPDALSRALLLFASVQVLGGVDCSAHLAELLDYYESLQEPCGGIREDDIFERTSAVEAGVASGKGLDRIGDQLYCNNYLFATLALLRRGRFPQPLSDQIERLYQGVHRYLLKIQIKSNDPRFDGAWMRAFNMDLDEYHGMAHDADWGPYCLMTGWVMGYIPLTLLEDIGGPPFFQPC